jgi:hypothetical protein
MIERDRDNFAELLTGVYDFYRKDASDQVLEIWWQAMKPFDLEAIRVAFGQHTMNPDNGRFLPMPADVVRMLGGSTLDSALVAFSKVERGISAVGCYATVVFDDPLIHKVIEEMGGWPLLCVTPARDWPFRTTEFLNRYRSYKSRGMTPAYPKKLIGIADGENAVRGFAEAAVTLIGDPRLAHAVLEKGSASTTLGLTRVDTKLIGNAEKA